MNDDRGLPIDVINRLEAKIASTQGEGREISEVASHPADVVGELELRPYREQGVSFAFCAYGVRIGVHLEDASLLPATIDRLPCCWRSVPLESVNRHYAFNRLGRRGDVDWYQLCGDDDRPVREGDHGFLLDILETSLEDLIAEFSTPWLFLHAGVVGWKGKGILIPAPSFGGKSTLTAALVAAGATYYSDEYAVLDPDARVHPYPRRISLRLGEHAGWRSRRIKVPGARGSAADLPPLTVRLVAILSHDPYRGKWVERLDRGAAIMALCEHSVAIRHRPADTFAVVQKIVSSAEVIRGCRGEAEDAAQSLLAICENERQSR